MKIQKLIYIANARMPSERAHSIQIAKMCEAFTRQGYEVELVIPRRWTFRYGRKTIHEFYNIKNKFLIKKLWTIDFLWLPFCKKLFFYLEVSEFAKRVKKYVGKKQHDIIFSRDPFSAQILTNAGMKICYEIHDMPSNTDKNRSLLHDLWRIVVTNASKKENIIKEFGISEDKILVAHNAVDFQEFNVITKTKEQLREELHLPLDAKIVMYSGTYATWKGLDTILNAAEGILTKSRGILTGQHRDNDTRGHINKEYPKDRIIFCFVGITPQSTSENSSRDTFEVFMRNVFREKYDDILKDIIFIPHQEHKRIPRYLKAADILVVPNTSRVLISAQDTSPIKLFEYMAARVPIIASAVPSVCEIVGNDETNVTLFAPDTPHALVEKIIEVIESPQISLKRVENAWQLVQTMTWDNRARKILEFLEQ